MANKSPLRSTSSERSTPPEFASAPPWQIRDEFHQLVVGDILGPAFGTDEVLPTNPPPRDRYLVGMLAPAEVRVNPAQMDDAGNTGDESQGEVSSNERIASVGFFPSSLGLSFAVDGAAAALQVQAEWGHYRKERRPREDVEGRLGFYIDKGDAEKDVLSVWQRYARAGSVTVTLAEGDLGPYVPVSEYPNVIVRGRTRRHNGAWLVTLFLVNDQPALKENIDQQWLFQAALSVNDVGAKPIFWERLEVVNAESADDDGELAQLAMLYRDVVEFAVGHGTAVHAEVDPNDPRHAVRLTTESVPSFEVPRTEQPDFGKKPPLAEMDLDMKVLAQARDGQFAKLLMPVVVAYRAWLTGQQLRVSDPRERLDGHEAAARDAIDAAGTVADRIETGIQLLDRDPDAAEAFRFANEAMWRQRIAQLAIAHRRREKESGREMSLADAVAALDLPANRRWRLFQIAFICLNLPSLTIRSHGDRTGDSAVVDLLFFPTGGGKTEAYLGLVAYTFAIRRLQGKITSDDGDLDGSEGVAVFMRYTLRLLTSQQFQRAAALVCACEVMRRERLAAEPRWGETPFRLGLWIGASTTPNWSDDSWDAIETARQRNGYTGSYADPLQLTACPWCGSELQTGSHVKRDSRRWRTLTLCSDPYGTCPFTERRSNGEGIPVVTVDEEIYRLLPSFIIATVDKFAQLPWRGPLHLLFGRTYSRCTRHGFRSRDLDDTPNRVERDTHKAIDGLPEARTIACDRLRPPDLIIQDELHLISGPLGTLVGLYETAVDRLASMSIGGIMVRPKVIASTATIRRALVQTNALFQRRLAVFPPAVLDIGDNFFSEQVLPTQDTPGRRYVGVCARGQRLKAAEARLVMSLLAAAQLLFEKYGPPADPYMTVVGYFSSLRELAGMRRLLDDDVQQRLPKAARRGLGKRSRLLSIGELTSRMRSDQIPKILDRLGLPHVPGVKRSISTGPFDVVLATNMISVGVDVPRLGLMMTVGQPKSTAEYIQATSRVGRDLDKPGIVFTLYNWSRPRDLSHYERFEHDHATFYRQVEALSVTPFSSRAIDRGLTAVAVSLVRQKNAHRALGPATNPESGAQTSPLADNKLREALDTIVRRVQSVQADPAESTEIARKVDELLDLWADRQRHASRQSAPMTYSGRGATAALLTMPQPNRWTRWNAPNSLRETEHTINLLLSESDTSALEERPYGTRSANATGFSVPSVEDLDTADAKGAQ